MYYFMSSILDVILVIRKLLHMLEILTISDAYIVDTNELKAGVPSRGAYNVNFRTFLQ